MVSATTPSGMHIIAAEAPEPTAEKYPQAFEIDLLRCIACGLSVEACPEDAIRTDTGLHTPPFRARDDAVVGRLDLLSLLCQDGAAPAFGAQDTRLGRARSGERAG